MTEAEWLSCTDPAPMLECLRGRAGNRKLRLLACAYAREFRDLHPLIESFVELAERYADGAAGEDEIAAARRETPRSHTAGLLSVWVLDREIEYASFHIGRILGGPGAGLLREIFGNPFRPVALDPRWLTSDAVALARGVYADGAFDRLPILADALQDAGCDNPNILDHLRGDRGHVRGCWALDLILAKG